MTGILKGAINPEENGIAVCGGKGKTSKKTPGDIKAAGAKFGFSEETIKNLTYISKMTAKVDNAAIQAGYQLYHHAFLITKDEKWAVIQQGMSTEDRTARRYHWLSNNVSNLVVEPHTGIVCDAKRTSVLNMVAKSSEAARKASVDLSKEPTRKLMNLIQSTSKPQNQTSLQDWLPKTNDPWQQTLNTLNLPRNINWGTLSRVYEFQPGNYEELLSIKGVGPATVRGLALVAELVYGEKPSWDDPVKFSFAFGGKDGVPYPVDRKAMDESIDILRQSVQQAKIGDKEKLRSLQRLRRFVPEDANF